MTHTEPFLDKGYESGFEVEMNRTKVWEETRM